MAKRIAFLMWGLCLFGFGIVLTVKSNLGTAPWDVLHLGLTNYLPLTLGQVSQGCGALVIALSWLLGIKPGWGSLANMIFIGFYIDFFMWLPFLPSPTALPGKKPAPAARLRPVARAHLPDRCDGTRSSAYAVRFRPGYRPVPRR